jgi:hypothetical protein
LRCPGKPEKRTQAAPYPAHSTCQAGLPGKLTSAAGRPCRNGCPVASQAIRQIAGQESGRRGGEVAKYRRHSLVFAKTIVNPAAETAFREVQASDALYEPRFGPCAAKVDPPLPGAIIAAHRSKTSPRRHDVALRRRNVALETARRSCISCLTAASVTLSPRRARRICMTPYHCIVGRTSRSPACRCNAGDPIVFLLRTIIPLFRERPAARGCFGALPPLQPVSHRRRSREAGGRFPYRCRI